MRENFETMIDSLDLTLFEAILSQTSRADRISLLTLQRATRHYIDEYVYLEIGSFLGGSIQPYMLDPQCRKIYSIDNRSEESPDERGPTSKYPGNSTEIMLDNLRALSFGGVKKIACFDKDVRDMRTKDIEDPPHICFIDGEHINSTVLSDFQFCLSVCDPTNAIIVFHDSNIIDKGIQWSIRDLRKQKIPFTAFKLADVIFVIALRESKVANDKNILRLGAVGGILRYNGNGIIQRWFNCFRSLRVR